jgi:hypothetical protein
MDKPSPPKPPENAAPAENLKIRQAREAQQKHNREVSHLLKSGAFHQHMARRSLPHVRGR